MRDKVARAIIAWKVIEHMGVKEILKDSMWSERRRDLRKDSSGNPIAKGYV